MWKLFYSTILLPFQLDPEQKKAWGKESHEKEAKQIHASAADLLLIIENLSANADIAKTKQEK